MRNDETTMPPSEAPAADLEDALWVITVLESDARLKKNIKIS
jgi:hypothetical protein